MANQDMNGGLKGWIMHILLAMVGSLVFLMYQDYKESSKIMIDNQKEMLASQSDMKADIKLNSKRIEILEGNYSKFQDETDNKIQTLSAKVDLMEGNFYQYMYKKRTVSVRDATNTITFGTPWIDFAYLKKLNNSLYSNETIP